MQKIEIRFPSLDGGCELVTEDSKLKKGDFVLVDNGQITELACVFSVKEKKSDSKEKNSYEWKFLRIANSKDLEQFKQLEKKAQDYLPLCREKIKKYDLETMDLLNAKLSFDEKKLTIFFSTEGRVDFRELVSDLIKSFKKIIRLQQIGSRDEAKILGGMGKCGREFCCSSFLREVKSVTLDDAKEQDIIFGINKLSGVCGKLMCCLVYELEEYKKMAENMPRIGEEVKVKKENCRVVSRNLIKQTYIVENKEGQRTEVEK